MNTDDPILRLAGALRKLPGVNEKNAVRMAFHLMKNPVAGRTLCEAVNDLIERSRPCAMCFSPSLTEICGICADSRRDPAMLCVVENVTDMLSVEKSGGYRGLYLVLGGVLSPLDGVGPSDLRLNELNSRARGGEVKEVIIATNMSSEGEATAAYVADMLAGSDATVSRIASGLPMGGEIEYADKLTISRAITGRRNV